MFKKILLGGLLSTILASDLFGTYLKCTQRYSKQVINTMTITVPYGIYTVINDEIFNFNFSGVGASTSLKPLNKSFYIGYPDQEGGSGEYDCIGLAGVLPGTTTSTYDDTALKNTDTALKNTDASLINENNILKAKVQALETKVYQCVQ